MKYRSTRNPAIVVDSHHAILEGLASDGGLYIPDFIPVFDLNTLKDLDFKSLMTEILVRYFDEYGKESLRLLVDQAFDHKFDDPEITPSIPLGKDVVLELYHGPTAAFKDVALSILPHLMNEAKKTLGIHKTTHILTATSGDTGSAAIAGFTDVPGFTITVFYPSVGISEIQKRQMTCASGHNVFVYGIKGNFDDAQNAVKSIFTRSSEFNLSLSSANSINIGRLVPQLSYYFKAYFDLVRSGKIKLGDPISVSVPSGNFGNILAAYLAKEGGLPIRKLICASNENRVLTDVIETGTYDRRRLFVTTTSPSMDILISSNLERLLALMAKDPQLINELMGKLTLDGIYTLPKALHDTLRSSFIGSCIPQDEVDQTIQKAFKAYGMLLDPHSAIGVKAAWDQDLKEPIVICATASPFKFPTTVLKALGRSTDPDEFKDLDQLNALSPKACPKHLSVLSIAPIRHPLTVDKEALYALVKAKEHHD